MGQLYACAGANRIPVDQLNAGDLGCTVKLKDVKTGNTLNGKGTDQRFDFIKYPTLNTLVPLKLRVHRRLRSSWLLY